MNEADRHDEVLAAANALNAAFAHAVDHHRLEELRGVLAENVEYVSGDHRLRGLEAVVARFAGRIAPRTTRHVPGPALVLADNGARVRTISVWTCFAAHTAAPSHGPVRPSCRCSTARSSAKPWSAREAGPDDGRSCGRALRRRRAAAKIRG
jgi:hypothetical protein